MGRFEAVLESRLRRFTVRHFRPNRDPSAVAPVNRYSNPYEGSEIPPKTLVAGVPAEAKTEIDNPYLEAMADRYDELSRRYAETSERLE